MMENIRAPSRAKATVHAIGLKSRPSTACNVKDRQIGRNDDADGIEDRALYLMCCLPDLFRGRLGPIPLMTEVADDIFHHHHGAVHDHAEVQRAEREQIGWNMLQVETNRSEQQREGDGKRNDESAAHVSQEEKENNNHQDDPFGQVVQHGMGGEVQQVAAIDEGNDLHPLRQDLIVQLLDLFV